MHGLQQSQNEKRSRKHQSLEASLRASYDEMLAKGLNPYEVQRRQLVEEKYKQDLQRQQGVCVHKFLLLDGPDIDGRKLIIAPQLRSRTTKMHLLVEC